MVYGMALEAPSVDNHLRSTYERWGLPAENMGMIGLGFERKMGSEGFCALETWMAVEGERGGFITLGMNAGVARALSDNVSLRSGLYIGAGGGRGGLYLSGGGLMLRPYLALEQALSDRLNIEAGISYVSFPNGGIIESMQPYLGLSIPFDYRMDSASPEIDQAAWVNALGLITSYVSVHDGVQSDRGEQQPDFATIGIEGRSYIADNAYIKMETAGAFDGDSSGYMQILAGGGIEYPLSGNMRWYADIATGGGGGGAVDTGGGWLVQGEVGCLIAVDTELTAAISGGCLTAPDGALDAWFGGISVGYQQTQGALTAMDQSSFERTRLRVVHQTYLQADPNWRSHHADQRVGNIGVQLDAFFNESWYVSGQGIAAESGKAGAYMAGMVGLGYEWDLTSKGFINIEGLVGAAGGGGIATGSGAVYQLNLGLGRQLTEETSISLSVGIMDAFDGPFAAEVIGLSYNCDFDLF